MKKTQSNAIHIGNQGEHIVSSALSKYCVVREVGQGKDTGIDLYCEIVNKKTKELSLHFFCQIKTGKSFSISSVKDKDFDYWSNQPVPVFLIELKYDNQDRIHEDNEIWIHDIPCILARQDAQKLGKKNPPRQVDERFLICEESNDKDKMRLEDFIYHHVPWSYGLWQMRRFGLVYPNPEIIKQERLQFFIGGFTYLYEEKINEAVNYAKQIIHWDKKRNQN
ncbi:MAG: DUF4365 domain-containing protein [Planctomycetota bacterium]|jgi:hypothetical protein